MISKKSIFPAAVVSMAFLAGCGDDSSSSGTSNDIPASVKTFEEIMDIPCNEAVKCQKILIEEHNDYMECDGTMWQTVSTVLPSTACPAEATPTTDPAGDQTAPAADSAAAPAADSAATSVADPVAPPTDQTTPATDPATPATDPATPATDPATPATDPATPATDPATPATDPATPATDPATPADTTASTPADPATPADTTASTPADPATPADTTASTPADPATPVASGDMVSCDIPGAMGECVEAAVGTDDARQMTETCESLLMGTLGTGCPK
jgi:hypothetical protein